MLSPDGDARSHRMVIVAVGAALIVLSAGACTILAVGHPVPTELWAAASALSGALVGILIPPSQSDGLRAARAVVAAKTHDAAITAAETAAQAAVSGEAPAVAAAAQAAVAKVWAAGATVSALASAQGGASPRALGLLAGAVADSHRAAARVAKTAEADAAAKASAARAVAEPGTDRNDAAQVAELASTVARVHSAVLTAAADAAGSSKTQQEAVDEGAVAARGGHSSSWTAWLATNLKTIVPLIVFVAALTIGVLLAWSVSRNLVWLATEHDAALTGVANTLIALAAAAGGAIVGVQAPTVQQPPVTTGDAGGGSAAQAG